jgi:hypothetical protein
MKSLTSLAIKLSPKARLIVFVATLALFVIGAGAPEAGGGFLH